MCLSKVFYVNLNGQQQEVMRDLALMEAHNNGFLLTGLLRGQKFVQGEARTTDFVDKHSVVLEVDLAKHDRVSWIGCWININENRITSH